MGPERLQHLIRQHGAMRLGKAMMMVEPLTMLNEGWDLTNWTAKTVPGAMLFIQVRDGLMTADPRILCVHAPESDRARWEAMLVEADAPTVLLMIGSESAPTAAEVPLPWE